MRSIKLGIPVLLVSVLALPGQENGELEAWMKATGASLGVLRKLEKKTGPESVAQAEKIGGIYENMIGFWRQRNAEDAVKLSADGKAAAVELASAANADDADKAVAAFNRLGGTCKACHDAHREKTADGKYKIK
jgi:cytochrome c556